MNRRDFLRGAFAAVAGALVVEPVRRIWQVPMGAPVRSVCGWDRGYDLGSVELRVLGGGHRGGKSEYMRQVHNAYVQAGRDSLFVDAQGAHSTYVVRANTFGALSGYTPAQARQVLDSYLDTFPEVRQKYLDRLRDLTDEG